MRAASIKSLGMANLPPAIPCSISRKGLQSEDAIIQQIRQVWPNKTALNVALLTGYSERAVAYWLAGRSRIPADAVGVLLRSEYGLQFLEAVMDGAKPAWWVRLLSFVAAIDARRIQRAAMKQLQEAIHEDEGLSDAIGRAEAAMSVCDPDFYRPHLEAARASRRPMGGRKG